MPITNPADLFARPQARTARLVGGGFVSGACVTPDEHEAAEAKCRAVTIRGLGQTAADYDASRWAGMPPCDVANLPICDCVGADEVAPIGGCFLGTAPPGWGQDWHDNWCAQVGAGRLITDYCPGNPAPPVPACLDANERATLSYCSEYGFGGSNALANALCWSAMKGGTLGLLNQLSDCVGEGPGYQQYTPAPPNGAPLDTSTGPYTERSSMMLPGLLLLLVVGGGAAYYVAQRKGKS